jgi:hypothetical protein
MRNAPGRLCLTQHFCVRIAHKTLRLQYSPGSKTGRIAFVQHMNSVDL